MEWRHLPKNKRTCPNFGEWVQYFYDGGYFPFNPGEKKNLFGLEKILSKKQWTKYLILRETK